MNDEEKAAKPKSADTILKMKAKQFVMRFVREFEAKLIAYGSILDGVNSKCGKYATYAEGAGQSAGSVVGGGLGFAVGFPGPGASVGRAVGGATAKLIGDKVGREQHQHKMSKLSDFICYFEQNKTEFRQMLVMVGLDIYQSFEMQFGRVTGDLSERGALSQLAIDAVNRAIDYIRNNAETTTLDLYSLILEGVKLGQSKAGLVPGRHKGFEIKYKHAGKVIEWKSASLYSKVGIVIIDNYNVTYYSKNDENDSVKYGFRRCFTCEKWEELEPLYTKTDLYELQQKNGQFLDYSYSSDIVEEYFDYICVQLEDERDEALGIDRIKTLLNETKDDILENLQILKLIYAQTEVESKILANVETDLKSLNCEEYYSEFNRKLDQILDQVSKGNDKLRKIDFSLEALNEKLESVNLASGSQLSSQINSAWFDVRNGLLMFTGRVAILDQIERDLKSGVVVICGLGGIGKSELAVKYAHTKYDKAVDHVIWVNAETEESMAGSIWQLAQAFNVNKRDNFGNEKHLHIIISEIYKIIFNQRCLLILDNAKSFSGIEPLLRWIPDATQSQLKVFVTSRNSSEWESGRFSIEVIQLEVFDRTEATEFVKKSLSLKDDSLAEDIDQLIHVLGCFPLALQLAVTNIKVTNSNYQKRNKQFTIADFLMKFEQEPQKLMHEKLPSDMYQQSIFAVISYAFKDLERENELGAKAQLVLKMASYMAPDNIMEEFFEDEFDKEEELIEAMSLLERYSLVKINNEKLIVHRLVQQAVRFECEQKEEIILRRDLNSFLTKFKKWCNFPEYASVCTPHVISIWQYACNYDQLIEEFITNFPPEFYVCTSFLQILVNRNELKVVGKIIDRMKNGVIFNKLTETLNGTNHWGEKLIGFALNSPEMLKLLSGNGAQIDYNAMAMAYPFTNPLHRAVSKGNLDMVKFLVADGHSVNFGEEPNPENNHCSNLHNNDHVVGAALFPRWNLPVTPLHLAVCNGNLDVVKFLLEHGAHVNAAALGSSITCLHRAVTLGTNEIVDELLKCENLDVNYPNSFGQTALHLAVIHQHLGLVKKLLDKNADLQIKDKRGRTAFDISEGEIRNHLFIF